MKAQFVFEKFEEESDPIRDMGIGAEYDVYLLDQFEPYLQEYIEKYSPYHSDPRKNNQINPSGMRKCFEKFKADIEPLILHKFVEGKMWKTNKGWVDTKIKVLGIKGNGSRTLFHPQKKGFGYFHVKALWRSNITGRFLIGDFALYLNYPYHVTLK